MSTQTEKVTFKFQSQLPKLPVPALSATAKKYLRSVKPLVRPETYARTENAVQEFVKPGGVGEELQRRLTEHAGTKTNWLYEFWNEGAYLGYRDPIVPYVSYCYSYKDDPRLSRASKRAAAIARAALDFKEALDAELLEPDVMRKQPIDMELIKYLFHTCRKPQARVDGCALYPAEGNEHFLVIRRNRFYKAPYIDTKGRTLNASEIEEHLDAIIEDADLKGTAPNVGVQSGTHRDSWVEHFADLLAAGNQRTVREIESAAFVINLDFGASPREPEERTAQFWHGFGQNRWYDKPVQFVICDNGSAGQLNEHSQMDGTYTLRLGEYVCSQTLGGKIDTNAPVKFVPPVEELPFNVNANILSNIESAQAAFDAEIEKQEVVVWNYDVYGKNAIKSFKVSPDSYMQMLFQIAYYRMYGKIRPVYESAATRKFAQGRTETTRSVTIESADFLKSFWDPNLSATEKIEKFRKAANSQVAYVADAAEGLGVDRHLFGLKKMLQEGEPVPSIYTDPVFSYSGSWYLSTSQLSSEYFNGWGFAEVIDDGFGLAYAVNADSLRVNISSKKRGSYQFLRYLQESAELLAKLLSNDMKPKL